MRVQGAEQRRTFEVWLDDEARGRLLSLVEAALKDGCLTASDEAAASVLFQLSGVFDSHSPFARQHAVQVAEDYNEAMRALASKAFAEAMESVARQGAEVSSSPTDGGLLVTFANTSALVAECLFFWQDDTSEIRLEHPAQISLLSALCKALQPPG